MNGDVDLKRIAQLKSDFLRTEFGEWMIPALAELYNGLHHDAEEAKAIEAKAMKVERAAGVRMVMDFLMNDAAMLEAGLLDEAKETDDGE